MNIAPTNFASKSHWGRGGVQSAAGRCDRRVEQERQARQSGDAQLARRLRPESLFPIHPGEKEILGRRVYPTIRDVPDPVDLALIAVPTDAVLLPSKIVRRPTRGPP